MTPLTLRERAKNGRDCHTVYNSGIPCHVPKTHVLYLAAEPRYLDVSSDRIAIIYKTHDAALRIRAESAARFRLNRQIQMSAKNLYRKDGLSALRQERDSFTV